MDPIADFLITVKNAYMAKKKNISVPYSKFRLAIANVLEKEKVVEKVVKEDKVINMNLIYDGTKPKITTIKKVSKLGLRVYTKSKNIKSIRGGRGIVIISTPQGVMSGKEAKSKKLGGEVICYIW